MVSASVLKKKLKACLPHDFVLQQCLTTTRQTSYCLLKAKYQLFNYVVLQPVFQDTMEETLILAPRICAVCGEKAGLLFCTGCRVVHYCGRKHQEDHRPAHKSACNAIKKATLALEKEETKLRSMLPDVFDTQVGRFWGIVETRDYMMTRFVAAKAILRVNNVDAVEKALSHLKDMLRLCRSDNLGMRDIVPFLHLRLGQEQECYDFLKSWLVDGSDGRKPNTDIRDADAFEYVDGFIPTAEPAHLVALTLLKLRLYLDFRAYQI